MSEQTEDDSALADSMAAHSGVVLAETVAEEGQILQAHPLLYSYAIASGHIDDSSDDFDGVTRRHKLYINGGRSLAGAVAEAYNLTSNILEIPSFEKGEMRLNWPAPVSELPYRSLIDVLDGKISSDEFRDKIVITGSTATGLDRWTRTPFDKDPAIEGIFVHAAALHINTVDFKKQLSPIILLASIGVICSTILIGFFLYWMSHLLNSPISIFYCLLFIIGWFQWFFV